MNLEEAYKILEVPSNIDDEMLKANANWLKWFYRPDGGRFKDASNFIRIVEAHKLVMEHRNIYGK